ncbi:hypothetical protein B1A_07297 [mine drainage metagenome]|uniref:Type II toxin-antitoxin system HicB family antitoxin n=1 Tax=mine drainage metagenome TaxID=410659 RepID=T1B6J3_9ZZZZ
MLRSDALCGKLADMKPATFTAAIRQADGWWFGWIEEVPGVNAQERMREDVLASLRECLAESIEMNRRAAIEAVGEGFEEVVVSA